MTALGCLDTEGAALLIDNITDPFSTVEGVVVTIVAVNIDDWLGLADTRIYTHMW